MGAGLLVILVSRMSRPGGVAVYRGDGRLNLRCPLMVGQGLPWAGAEQGGCSKDLNREASRGRFLPNERTQIARRRLASRPGQPLVGEPVDPCRGLDRVSPKFTSAPNLRT